MHKKRLKISQKGISDLISNILIISFVIIIAIILFSWGYNYFDEMQEQRAIEAQKQLTCAGIFFSIKEVCSTYNRIEITLENQVSDNIFELVYRLKDNKAVISSGVASRQIGGYSTKKYQFGYISKLVPNTIELFPTIKIENTFVTCDNLIRAENIKNCISIKFTAGEPEVCGDGIVSSNEDCDRTSFKDDRDSCIDYGNYDGGSLYCKNCQNVFTGCRESSPGGGGGGSSSSSSSSSTSAPDVAIITCVDADGDGFTDINCGGTDCDDDSTDDTLQYNLDENVDIDGDGNYAEHINPNAEEIDNNSIDENCDGSDVKC